jgi:hypothetical protein
VPKDVHRTRTAECAQLELPEQVRWIAAGMGEAAKQFRRANGRLHLSALRIALGATAATPVTSTKEDAA